ncbi:MAG: ABC transporter permease [Candidatus Bathyarchaeia archaeon]
MLKGTLSHPYVKFIAKKVVFYGFVTFIALSLAFYIPRRMPGSPVQNWIRGASNLPQYKEIAAYIMNHLGLDRPDHEQYINFWSQLLQWPPDLGKSFHYNDPVAKSIMAKLPYTLVLVFPVLVISFLLGNWIGARAAYMGGKPSELTYFLSVFSNRLPSWWFGYILYFVFITTYKIFPIPGGAVIPGITSPLTLEYIRKFFNYYTLPFLTLFIIYLGGWATGMRSMVIHEMDSGYVRYTDQLGFRKSKSMGYVRRNAILPQFTGINLYLNALIGETIVVERIFGWPGIGDLIVEASHNCDYPLVIGSIVVVICVVVLGNFIIDVLYGFVDPRIRLGRGW